MVELYSKTSQNKRDLTFFVDNIFFDTKRKIGIIVEVMDNINK